MRETERREREREKEMKALVILDTFDRNYLTGACFSGRQTSWPSSIDLFQLFVV